MTVEALLVGAGQRGRYVYGAFAERKPDRLRFTAVAEPNESRRHWFGDTHDIPADRRFASWEDAFTGGAPAPLAVVASPDRLHAGPAEAALAAGCHVLLEKPIAHTLEATIRIVEAARRSSGHLHVAHVLRATPFFTTLHEVVTSERVGDLVSVEHRENVAAWHMAHSFVRGNWSRSGDATPMIVQKCCHDFDILAWNLDAPVEQLSSFGSLLHFRPEHAPEGATERCGDPCPHADTCPFDAGRIYLDMNRTGWPVHVITDDLSADGRRAALASGPYGRCVYRAGSDVVDNQTVAMSLASGATATVIMHGHSDRENRAMRYDGTRGTVRAVFGSKQIIEVSDHRGGDPQRVPIASAAGGHGGGDPGLISGVLEAVEQGTDSLTSGDASLESHLLAFAAEEARMTGAVIDVGERRRQVSAPPA